MIEKIIVSDTLLSIRNGAAKGDVNCLFELAKHVVKGEETKACGDTAMMIISTLYEQKTFLDDLPRFWNTIIMTTHALKLMQQAGEISYHQYIKDSCQYLEWLIRTMTDSPRSMWDYEQLENCVNWIRENEPKLFEKEEFLS